MSGTTPEEVVRVTGHAVGALQVLATPNNGLTFRQTEELLDMVALALAPRIIVLLERRQAGAS